MKPDRTPLEQLIESVADGRPVDWDAASSSATPEDLRLLRDLRLLASLSEVHRSIGGPAAGAAKAEGAVGTWRHLVLLEAVGRGSFGQVFRALDPQLQREVALKLLDGAAQEQALSEARALARVSHPHVVMIYGVEADPAGAGLWMEFVKGRTLGQLLVQHGEFGAAEASLVGQALCSALAAVHAAGLVHRDVKAQNVMREDGGRIVLMDFGAGCLASPGTAARPAGTPLYLAPEVFWGSAPTAQSDLYSAGVLLFHLVTGSYPVSGPSFDHIARAHRKGERARLRDIRPKLPDAFVQVVERALAPDPAARFASAGGMEQALAACLTVESRVRRPRPAAGESRANGIAVLPFVALGPDPGFEYFGHGLADELITGLGTLPGLRVASRTSTSRLQASNASLRAIGRRLNVGLVLEGSVRKSGERIRVSAQLVNTANKRLWSERYDRTMEDVFDIQDEIARSVVDCIRAKVLPGESGQAAGAEPLIRRYTQNRAAYHQYLKGRFYWSQRYEGGLLRALEHFQQALAEDPGHAPSYAGLADAYSFLGFYSLITPKVGFARAYDAVQRALAIDDRLAEAHVSLGLVLLGDRWDFGGAEREFERAIALAPGRALGRIFHSWLQVLTGREDEGFAEAERAQELDPLSPLVNSGVGYAYYIGGKYERGIIESEKALEFDRDFLVALYTSGMCYSMLGRYDEAVPRLERCVELSRRAPFYLGLLGKLYADLGRTADVDRILDELRTLAAGTDVYVPPHCFTFIYDGLGRLDEAFAWQEKAEVDGAAPFNYLAPCLRNMHADPRHREQMRRRGFVPPLRPPSPS